MIALLATLALAEPPDTSLRGHTAAALPAGDAVIRWPLGRSAVGVTERDDLFVTPLDLTIGGPRVGWEHAGHVGGTAWSLAPSAGVKASGKRASLRLDAAASWDLGPHQLTVELGVDARWLRQLVLDDDRSAALSFDRLQTAALGVWDTPHSRVKLRLPLTDHDRALSWGTVSAAWAHTSRRVHVAAGVGMLVGRPFDRYTLGAYHWWFWLPYPELDLAVRI